MAPKRTARVVKTTKKVLEETVEVLTVPYDSQNTVDVRPGDSEAVEVDVRTEETQVPIADKPTQEEEEPEAAASKEGSSGDGKDKETEPRTPKKAEKPPQREAPAEKGDGGGSDEDREKEAKPRTPKEVEQPPKREAAEKGKDGERQSEGGGRRRRGMRRRTKRYSGPGGGIGEMDGVGRGYKRYVFQVLKQVHPELGISSRAMAVVDAMLGDMFERLADEAGRLSAYVGKTTLSSREIQAAVQLVLPGELGKHAITEGTNAVTNYLAAAAADAADDAKQ